jgi:hypothetical protein
MGRETETIVSASHDGDAEDVPSDGRDALRRLLDTYVASGRFSRSALVDLAESLGGDYGRRVGGVHRVVVGGRVVLGGIESSGAVHKVPLSTVPCATCDSMPIGYFAGFDERPTQVERDVGRRYGCGPHEPVSANDSRAGQPEARSRAGHVHGYAFRDDADAWVCIADYHAGAGCGAVLAGYDRKGRPR